jgi:bifunctional N-acetylglucosamine-1-phosphate-uridyltransferase/glucosamine-1-phosphate-acetyltransferase GlmU-like protein
MKKLSTILFFFTAFISNAQRTMFGSNNNYVAPVVVGPPTLVTAGLVLNLD